MEGTRRLSRETILIRNPIHFPAVHLLDSRLNPRIRWTLFIVSIVNIIVSTSYALYLENYISVPKLVSDFFEHYPMVVYAFFGVGLLLIVRLIMTLYETVIVSLRKLMLRLMISYFLVIYSFALIFFFISHHNPGFFNAKINYFTSIYFSTICITTVGFGDVYATATATRAVVVAEVLFGVFFNVFAFSVVSSLALQKVKFQPPEVSVAVHPHATKDGAQASEVKVSIKAHDSQGDQEDVEASEDQDAPNDDASPKTKNKPAQEVNVSITPRDDEISASDGSDASDSQELNVSIQQDGSSAKPMDKKPKKD